MGYWGTLIAACTNGQVPGLLRDHGAEIREHQHARRGDGWQVFSVPDNLVADDDVLSRLALESGAPLLTAYIADSDYGWLVGVSPTKGTWQAWLDPKTALVFERDYQVMQGIPKSEANRRARQMIRKFGLRPTEAAEMRGPMGGRSRLHGIGPADPADPQLSASSWAGRRSAAAMAAVRLCGGLVLCPIGQSRRAAHIRELTSQNTLMGSSHCGVYQVA